MPRECKLKVKVEKPEDFDQVMADYIAQLICEIPPLTEEEMSLRIREKTQSLVNIQIIGSNRHVDAEPLKPYFRERDNG